MHRLNGCSLTLGLANFRFFHSLGVKDGRLLFCLCFQDLGLLVSLGHQNTALLLALGGQDGLAALALRFHLLFHGVLNFPGRDNVFQLHPVHLNTPRVRGLVRILVLMVSREVRVLSSSISPIILRSVVADRFSMAEMGLSTP